jgi:hypothetical protein
MEVAIRDVLAGGWARQQKTAVCFTSFPKGFRIRLVLYPADPDALINCIIQPQRVHILSGAPLVMVSIWGRKGHLPTSQFIKWIDWYQFRPTSVFIRQYL